MCVFEGPATFTKMVAVKLIRARGGLVHVSRMCAGGVLLSSMTRAHLREGIARHSHREWENHLGQRDKGGYVCSSDLRCPPDKCE